MHMSEYLEIKGILFLYLFSEGVMQRTGKICHTATKAAFLRKTVLVPAEKTFFLYV